MNGIVMPSRYRSREWFIQRIHTLNNKNCTTGAQVNAVFREMTELSVEMAREVAVVALVQTFAQLIENTPKDTGRAKAGWQIIVSPSEREFVPGKTPESVASAAARAIPSAQDMTQADIIWVINNVEYILALNAGWSKNIPGGFIDNFLLSLRVKLEEETRQMNKVK